MLRYIFILFFIFIQVSASTNDFRIKARHKGDTVYVKALIHYPTMTYKEAKRKTGDERNARFITHIRAKIDNRTVFDVYTSPYLTRTYNQLSFTYICRENNDTLNIIATDNKGMKIIKHPKIKRYDSKNYQKKQKIGIHLIDYRKEKPDIWNAISIEDAIKELYGSKKIILEPESEQICGAYARLPLKLSIQTGKNIKSIAVFQDHRIRPTVAIFNTPVNENNNLTLHVSTERDDNWYGGEGNFTIILENTDGNLHKIIQKYDVAGIHESCYGNEVKNDL